MKTNKILKLITAIGESVLGIPFLGGLLVLASGWSLLLLMLVLHIVALIFSIREKSSINGNIVGIIASTIGWIPFVGMALHIASAIVLWTEFSDK